MEKQEFRELINSLNFFIENCDDLVKQDKLKIAVPPSCSDWYAEYVDKDYLISFSRNGAKSFNSTVSVDFKFTFLQKILYRHTRNLLIKKINKATELQWKKDSLEYYNRSLPKLLKDLQNIKI